MAMLTKLRSRLVRLAIPTILIAGSLTAAQPAGASDFCVGPPLCPAGVNKAPDLQTALNWAALSPDSDRIILSGDTFTAPSTNGWVYNSSGPVEISGAGIAHTVLTGPPQLKQLLDLEGGPGTTIHDLSIQLPQMAGASTGLFTNASVKGVVISEPTAQAITHLGVSLIGNGALDGSSVTMFPGTQAIGVALAGSATMKDSSVSAHTAVASTYGGTIQRSWLTGDDYALKASGGTTNIENSVLRVNSASGAGIGAFASNDPHPVVNADGLTMTTGLVGGHAGVHAQADNVAGVTVNVNMKNSILRGLDVPVEAVGTGAGVATVATSWSDFDPSKTQATGNATISKSNISFVANPGFVNPVSGNFRLASSSPLVDAGDQATSQGLDMDGNPRVTDGNLDGSARRDIGAYEVPGPLPLDPPPADQPAGGSAGQLPAGSASAASTTAASTTAGGGASAAPADTVAPVISGLKTTNKAFAVGRARTALAAVMRGTSLRYSLSEAAKVTVTIRRVRDGRVVGKLTRTGAKGSNAVKFSGRMGRCALRSGRYLAVLTATDAAGNRSAAKRVGFRVVAG
jgi:hypothetical protein